MIKTQFSYQEDNMKSFFRFHLSKKSNVRWLYYALAGLFLIIAIIVAFVIHKLLMGFIMIIASLIMVLIYPLRVNSLAKKTAQAKYKRPDEEIVFDEDKIIHYSDKGNINYSYNQILEVDETKKYIYFYISKNGALIVEKDKLKEDEYNLLISLIEKKQLKHFRYSL